MQEQLVVCDRSCVRFWSDKWCIEKCLQVTFSTIFEIACVKDAAVINFLAFSNSSPHWNVDFIKMD